MTATHTPATTEPVQPPTEPTRTAVKSRGGLIVGLGVLACVAACAAPLVLAGGLLAGLGALFTDSDVLGPLILTATGGGVLLWWQRRRTAAARAAAGTCGCGGGC
jgi:mercuric ion transport protein